jgi:hypothetical protein
VSLSIASFEQLVMKHGNDRGADLYEEYFWKKRAAFPFQGNAGEEQQEI